MWTEAQAIRFIKLHMSGNDGYPIWIRTDRIEAVWYDGIDTRVDMISVDSSVFVKESVDEIMGMIAGENEVSDGDHYNRC